MDKGLLIVLAGVPGCGKSTVAKDISNRYGFQIVSSDAIRKELYGDEAIQGDGRKVFEIAHRRTRDLLHYTNVVFDATNCKVVSRVELLNNTAMNSRYSVCVVFDTPLNESIKRNSIRNRKVPEKVITKMAHDLKDRPPSVSEGFDAVIRQDDLEDELDTIFGKEF